MRTFLSLFLLALCLFGLTAPAQACNGVAVQAVSFVPTVAFQPAAIVVQSQPVVAVESFAVQTLAVQSFVPTVAVQSFAVANVAVRNRVNVVNVANVRAAPAVNVLNVNVRNRGLGLFQPRANVVNVRVR